MENNSPYCPICSGCGEEGCCTPLNCEMSKDGHYCKTYLRDLRFGYAMYVELYEILCESDPLRAEAIFDKIYDKIYDQ